MHRLLSMQKLKCNPNWVGRTETLTNLAFLCSCHRIPLKHIFIARRSRLAVRTVHISVTAIFAKTCFLIPSLTISRSGPDLSTSPTCTLFRNLTPALLGASMATSSCSIIVVTPAIDGRLDNDFFATLTDSNRTLCASVCTPCCGSPGPIPKLNMPATDEVAAQGNESVW